MTKIHTPFPDCLSDLYALHDRREKELLDYLLHFLSYASVSAEPEFKGELRRCVNWLRSYLEESGFSVEIWETVGHPVLFATWTNAGPDKPTVLIYNHYDVQPVDPLDEWLSAPFEPTVRDGQVFARGAVDNKGQCSYVLGALRALLERDGTLPVNVKLCIEGEEEAGSHGLSLIIPSKREELRADHLLVVDLALEHPDEPEVCLGVRGISTMTVEVSGSHIDLHSGGHGGLAYNPNHAMVEILAKLRDGDGRVLVPGFYDDVVELNEEERQTVSFEFDTEAYRQTFGIEPTGGERGIPPGERVAARPTLEINGMSGGYTGSGFKTVIPAKAIAKLSCRLVPNQDPERVVAQVLDYITRLAPPGIRVEVHPHHHGRALRTHVGARCVRAAAQAFSEVLGKPCRFRYEGGSIPIIARLAEVSGAEVALFGYGLPTDGWHAPNEHFGLDRFRQGFVTIARILQILGDSGRDAGR